MRSLHIIVPRDRRELVVKTLSQLSLEFVEVKGSENSLIIVPVSEELADLVVDSLSKIGVGAAYGHVQMYPLEFASRVATRTEAPWRRAPRPEVLRTIREMSSLNLNYVTYMIIASLLAALGLLEDNIIVLIASMIIAPAIGPILGFALGTTLNLPRLRKSAAVAEAIGLTIAVVMGFVTALAMPTARVSHLLEMRSRVSVSDVVFALVAGMAAALSVLGVAPVALVGVAIAASIIPPAVATGIGLCMLMRGARLAYDIAVWSLAVLIINLVSIETLSLLVFWLSGMIPALPARRMAALTRIVRTKIAITLIVFVLVITPVMLAALDFYRVRALERRVEDFVRRTLRARHPELVVIDVRARVHASDIVEVNVTVGVPQSYDVTNLARELATAIRSEFGMCAEVRVLALVLATA